MSTFHNFSLDSISGQPIDFSVFNGKVVLVVNVASKCGLTPQYKGLQSLYEEFKNRNFIILGFPANNFGAQEPGTHEEIQAFCEINYGVTFPIFSKISVKGSDIHPIFDWLTKQSVPSTDVEWNFQKFLIGKDGKLVKVFSPTTKPEDVNLISEIKRLL